jgi:hypothetical protein
MHYVAMETQEAVARKWIAAGAVVCAFLVVDFITSQFLDIGPEWPQMILVGVCIGQVNLIATWAALAPGNVVLRLPWALLLSVLMWYSLVLGGRAAHTHYSLDDALVLGLSLLIGVVSAQIPLWIAGRLFRWRLVSWAGAALEPSQGRLQFELWHLMLGMVFVSIGLAPGRVILPPGDFRNVHLDYVLFVVLSAVVVCNLLVAVPCIWGAFARKTMLVPLAMGWLVYCAVVTAIEFGVLVAVLGPPGVSVSDALFLFYLLNVSQCLTVFATLLVFRGRGFRLLRVPSRRAQAAGQSPFSSTDADRG